MTQDKISFGSDAWVPVLSVTYSCHLWIISFLFWDKTEKDRMALWEEFQEKLDIAWSKVKHDWKYWTSFCKNVCWLQHSEDERPLPLADVKVWCVIPHTSINIIIRSCWTLWVSGCPTTRSGTSCKHWRRMMRCKVTTYRRLYSSRYLFYKSLSEIK